MGGTLGWPLWFLGEVVFKWVPGTVVAIATSGISGQANAPVIAPITGPVTASQIASYLQYAAAPGVYDTLFHYWNTFVAISLLVSLILGAFVLYCVIRIFQVRRMERARFMAVQHPVAAHSVSKTQLRWSRILEQAHSDNDQSWRLAILEADIMLNELLDTLGYRGETMADKMKTADRATFATIDLAWEAHKVRNRIAHSGVAHELNAREVRRIISLYERVFREFHFVS